MYDISLKEQERILDEIRRYGLTLVWPMLFGFIFLVTASFFMFWLFQHDWWGQSLFGLLVLVGFFIIVQTFFLWKRNVFLITTHRLIDVEQRGFFGRVVSEIPYDQIEDVLGKISGFFGTIFRYGTVEVQTGTGKIKILVPSVKRPLQIQQKINEMRERYISKYAHDFSGDVAQVIIDKLYELELPELRRVQKILDKRIEKLNNDVH
ncbi:MAG: PH domain-containing protein [Candidatus Magasanikbacteria bacterium]